MVSHRIRILAALCAFGWAAAWAQELPVYPQKGQVLQRLHAFDNPEGSIFSLDGRWVFVSNSAELGMPEKGLHWTHGRGHISKLAVQSDGTLKMVEPNLVTGLTGPLGMAVLPVDTKRFPKGTIFVVEAWAPLAEADGTEVKDANAIDPKIVAFNENGQVLGAIKLGKGSAAERAAGVVATLGNALAFDKQGNLYLAETGVGGGQFDPPIPTNGGGVYMFPVGALDALASGDAGSQGNTGGSGDAGIRYIPVPQGGPDGIEVSPDGVVNFNTVGPAAGLKDPAEGGMYRLHRPDFEQGRLPPPFNHGLGALDGLDFAGTARLDTEIKNTSSVIVTPFWTNRSYRLTYDQDIKLAGPADIAVRKQSDGSYLLVIPELSPTSPNNDDNPVTVVRLPAGFDRYFDER